MRRSALLIRSGASSRLALPLAMAALLVALSPDATRAQDGAQPMAAVVEGDLFRGDAGSTTRRIARQWSGSFVETRYVDEQRRRMAYLVRWQVNPAERDRVPWHDLDEAIRGVFDDVEPHEGKGWSNGVAQYRLFGLGQGQQALTCAGFRREEGDAEGTFGLLCRPAVEPMATDEAERFAKAVRTGPDPVGTDDEPPT